MLASLQKLNNMEKTEKERIFKMYISGDRELVNLAHIIFWGSLPTQEDIYDMQQYINRIKHHLIRNQQYERAAFYMNLERAYQK